jgi:pimeloyl-ACP methyl ester carboxylesterase
MQVDWVRVTTRDGVMLDGVWQAAQGGLVDAVCMVHGTGGNFYSSSLLNDVAERFLSLGVGVMRVNTRGHDLMSSSATVNGSRRFGAAYEVVDDCRHDLAAWIDWLSANVGPRVLLVGHSLGAVKCLYAQTHEPSDTVVGVLSLSPPLLSHERFMRHPDADPFRASYALAMQRVQAGEPSALIEAKQPLALHISASGFVEKYGPDERYNYLRFVDKVTVPTLTTFGGVEVQHNLAFQQAPELLGALSRPVLVVPEGDHFYNGVRYALWQGVAGWLRGAFKS